MIRISVLPRAAATLLSVLLIALIAQAKAAPPTPAPPPAPPALNPAGGVRTLVIGPRDSMENPRMIRGKMTVVVSPPQDVSPASVEVFAGSRSIGTAAAKPFKIEFDTTTMPDGEITIKAVGKDSSGKEVWTCSQKAAIVNSRDSGRVSRSVRSAGTPDTMGGPGPQKPVSRPPRVLRSEQPNKDSAKKDSSGSPVPLEQDYANDDYGFSIRYPSKWTYKDKSISMKPRTPGCFWIAFGEYPLEKARVVVNVRRSKIDPDTDAEKFARYNSYVRTWERDTVLGSPAFKTTSRDPLRKQVIHRLIVIKDGYAWMLNCEDSSGKSADESLRLFESMVNTLKIGGPGAHMLGPGPAGRPGGPADNRPAPEDRPKNVGPGDAPPPPPPMNGSSGADTPPEPIDQPEEPTP